jgi:tetratricopeptide (TPR) repeat protein
MIITGRLPFGPEAWPSLKDRIVRGDYPAPRQIRLDVSKSLEAICLKAMSRNPIDRYLTASDLGRDIQRWLAEEPVSAYPEPWDLRVRRWVKRHRTGVNIATTTVMVATLLLGGMGWMLKVRTQRTDSAALESLSKVDRLENLARATSSLSKWSEAIAEARRAEALLETGGGSASLRSSTSDKIAELAAEETFLRNALDSKARDQRMVNALEEARILRSNDIEDNRYNTTAMEDAYGNAFRSYGIEIASQKVAEAVSKVRSSPIKEVIIAALDDWEINGKDMRAKETVSAILAKADTDPVRAEIANAIARKDSAFLARMVEQEEGRRKLGVRCRRVFHALSILDPTTALPILEAIRREHPSDFWLNHDISSIYYKLRPTGLSNSISYCRVAVALRPESAGVRFSLGVFLNEKGDLDEAALEFREAIRLSPGYAAAHNNLGNILKTKQQFEQAALEYREAFRLKPNYALAHFNLGTLLSRNGDREGAIVEFHEAIRLEPNDADSHYNLGVALKAKGDLSGAISEYREAVRYKDNFAEAHNGLGLALAAAGKIDGAIEAYRKAIRLKPDFAVPHNNLALIFYQQGKLDDAAVEFREAIRIIPNYVPARNNLGAVLMARGDIDGALSSYLEVVRLKPDFAQGHYNVGTVYYARRDYVRAAAEFREAIRLQPDYMEAHHNLGSTLSDNKHLDEAISEFNEAIRLKPDDAESFCRLGLTQRRKGLLTDSLNNIKTGHDLGTKSPEWRHSSADWLREGQKLVELDKRLREILGGQETLTDPMDLLSLASLCSIKKFYANAARFYEQAFAEQPTLADDMDENNRYNAACSAALAASDQGMVDPPLNEATRAEWRAKALSWLRADFAVWNKSLEAGPPQEKPRIRQTLDNWKREDDLASIRDNVAIDKLPHIEQEGFRALWSDVDRLVQNKK